MRKLKFLGHIRRKERLGNLTLTGQIEVKKGTRVRQKQYVTYLTNLDSRTRTGRDYENTNITYRAIKDRKFWIAMFYNEKSRCSRYA